MKDEIIWIPIDELIPYEHNAKEHTETQINNLVKSFEKYGWVAPCIITRDNVIVAGHGRVLGAKKAGLTKAKCLYADGLTDEQIKEYRHIDNLLSEGNYIQSEFDFDMPDLSDFDFSELDLNIDLDGEDFDDNTVEIVEDDIPEEAEPICKLGDIWVLGNHRLICGDSSKAETFETLMGG